MAITPVSQMFYRLDEHTPVPCALTDWAAWMTAGTDRVVQQTYVRLPNSQLLISTVFIGINRNYGTYNLEDGAPDNRPMLFETMLFGTQPLLNDLAGCTASWAEALNCHNLAVAGLLARLPGAHIITHAQAMQPSRWQRFLTWLRKGGQRLKAGWQTYIA